MKKRALISVSDKTGIADFARELVNLGYEIISTGGTLKHLKEHQIPVIPVDEITGFPECLDGRVKTLHPRVHAGILAIRSNEEHMRCLEEMNINTIDIVAVNLYPFKQTVLKPGVEFQEAIENIDIGGPSMIRAAAKNFQDVAVIVNPEDYAVVLSELKSGGISQETKLRLCWAVFEHTAAYDALIAQFLRSKVQPEEFTATYTPTFELVQQMRYGENPHQKAAFYKEIGHFTGALPEAKQLHGKELSFNNINDANGALELLAEFDGPTAVAVKHSNPCGVGEGESIFEAYTKAYEADPVSVFGGIVALNRPVDLPTAQKMSEIFLEIVIAPSYEPEAFEVLSQKKNIRLLELDTVSKVSHRGYNTKKVYGGLLVQEYDDKLLDGELTVVTKRAPSQKEMEDLLFAWKLVKHVKSNGIAIAKDGQSLGLGIGQVNRIWPTQQAIEHSGEKVKGAALASDAFFPFDDCVKAAAQAGITCIIQPGGSRNDQMSIDAADEAGIAMLFTGIRHFKH